MLTRERKWDRKANCSREGRGTGREKFRCEERKEGDRDFVKKREKGERERLRHLMEKRDKGGERNFVEGESRREF